VPVVSLVNVVPTPGGLGGFELALAAVVAGLAGIDIHESAAGVILYRISNYWLLLLLGGVASASLSLGLSKVAAEAEVPEPRTDRD
jgi:uncharacterized membrane protein YbhN (UPF0104 family)